MDAQEKAMVRKGSAQYRLVGCAAKPSAPRKAAETRAMVCRTISSKVA
jgi:hypothetical protein